MNVSEQVFRRFNKTRAKQLIGFGLLAFENTVQSRLGQLSNAEKIVKKFLFGRKYENDITYLTFSRCCSSVKYLQKI